MKLDYSWESLFKPGEALEYFNRPSPTPLQTNARHFNLSNAWWLAEISRLTYHPDFYEDKDINSGCLEYEKIGFIDNKDTSTYVALLKVNAEKPCLVISFRGTDEIDDWNINVHAYQTSFNDLGKVHSGFKKAYTSIRDELFEYLNNNSLPIFITGHSLGAALATLAAAELSENKNFDSCYTFGSPRTGDPDFINSIKFKKIYRIVNNCDVVTTVPIDFALIIYKHAGSPYLINDNGELIEDMNEEDIYAYQKERLQGLKEYAKSKFFSKDIKSIKDDLPAFLADHAPINYVIAISNLL